MCGSGQASLIWLRMVIELLRRMPRYAASWRREAALGATPGSLVISLSPTIDVRNWPASYERKQINQASGMGDESIVARRITWRRGARRRPSKREASSSIGVKVALSKRRHERREMK